VQIVASTRCFSEVPLLEACEHIAHLEFDKIEILMDEQGDHFKPSEVLADPEGAAARFRDGTRLTPTAFMLDRDVDTETLTALMYFAKLLKVALFTIRASEIGTPFNTEIDRLRELTSLTSKEGIRVAIKTETGRLTEDPHTAIELCQSVPGLGVTLDPSYYICRQPQAIGYDMVFPHVFHVHLRDTSPTDLQVLVGLGEVDYSRLINLLENEHYDRLLSVELIPEKTDPESRPLEMRKLRLLLESLL
jgi:sugar phosphate isomerase/epimerase